MDLASEIFTKGERDLLYDILTGQAEGTKGVKIPRYRSKVEQKLILMKEEVPEKSALNLMICRRGNRQSVFRAVYLVCEDERPGLYKRLQPFVTETKTLHALATIEEVR